MAFKTTVPLKKFADIDGKLFTLSEKLNATLTKDRPGYPEVLRTFEERRIDWVDNGIYKAIFIQPTFKITCVNSDMWDFKHIAWFEDSKSITRPQWIKTLLEKKDVEFIKNNIDELLFVSENYFKKIKQYSGEEFCTFFNNPALNFQILDDEEIKKIYCEECRDK